MLDGFALGFVALEVGGHARGELGIEHVQVSLVVDVEGEWRKFGGARLLTSRCGIDLAARLGSRGRSPHLPPKSMEPQFMEASSTINSANLLELPQERF